MKNAGGDLVFGFHSSENFIGKDSSDQGHFHGGDGILVGAWRKGLR